MITNGQARRIAAEWQAPGNAFSVLQHTGEVISGLVSEISAELGNLRFHRADLSADEMALAVRELGALERWAFRQGLGPVQQWGAWDDTPVPLEESGSYREGVQEGRQARADSARWEDQSRPVVPESYGLDYREGFSRGWDGAEVAPRDEWDALDDAEAREGRP
jgi:hypothetical protein